MPPPALGDSNQLDDRCGAFELCDSSSAGRSGDRCRAGDRIGLLGVSDAGEGRVRSGGRAAEAEAECTAGLECARVMVGALNAAPLDRERM